MNPVRTSKLFKRLYLGSPSLIYWLKKYINGNKYYVLIITTSKQIVAWFIHDFCSFIWVQCFFFSLFIYWPATSRDWNLGDLCELIHPNEQQKELEVPSSHAVCHNLQYLIYNLLCYQNDHFHKNMPNICTFTLVMHILNGFLRQEFNNIVKPQSLLHNLNWPASKYNYFIYFNYCNYYYIVLLLDREI